MNQTIILPIVVGVKQINCIIAILASHTLANNIFKLHPNVLINEHTVTLRKLINLSKRIILSNVYPSILNKTISTALNELGIRTTSNITFFKAGFNTSELAYITSYRRQVYISPEYYNNILPSLVIDLKNTNLWIFLTYGTVTCFACEQIERLSSSCKNTLEKYINPSIGKNEENIPTDIHIPRLSLQPT